MYVLLLLSTDKSIATTKGINYVGKLFPNEVEITEEQYNSMDEFPCSIVVENGKVISWAKTTMPESEPIVQQPTLEERVQAVEEVILNLL